MNIRAYIENQRAAGKHMLAVLIDPDKMTASHLPAWSKYLTNCPVDFIFIGGSTGTQSIDHFVRTLRKALAHDASIPPHEGTERRLILFPGNIQQFTPEADALLFLSLISGRNPQMLIGNQVRAARRVAASGIETIPMGYILVEGGKISAVEKVTETKAIPANDTEQIIDTALAAQLLGMQLIYLEAGSGAAQPVAKHTIQQVRAHTNLPLIVGGGICNICQMKDAFEAGADIVVIGNHFEQHPDEIQTFAQNK